MFDWLKRRAREESGAPQNGSQLKRLTEEADALWLAGKPTEARTLYTDILGVDPRDLYVLYQLATLLHQQGDLAEAQRFCEQGLAVDPGQIGLRARHASICHDRADHRTALADYQLIQNLAIDYPGID